ncbi:MAG: GHMP kinase [Nitrospinota bacterium]|nr:GHMP kinase [Nitrospinota bacterium]
MIRSSAPTRIDLAGGTLDLWPLHLFFDNPPTLNAAINLYATVEVIARKDKAIIIESRDLGHRAKFRNLAALPEKHPLVLLIKLIRFYQPKTGLHMITDCQAPAGSGIGGSSALNIALNGALNRFTNKRYNRDQMIDIARNIETQVIDVPAGSQDYYSAMYGGVQSIQPGMVKIEPRHLPMDLKDLNRRFVLCYTGQPHHSGINNWSVYKKTIDGNAKTLKSLSRIAEVTRQMEKQLVQGRLARFEHWFNEEWKARKALAPGISTASMDRMILTAKKKGALAAKVCGAGGGGCIAFFVPPRKRNDVVQVLQQHGGNVLNFKFVSRGLRVHRS